MAHNSTSSEPSAGDPPLYMSGRNFVEAAGQSTASRSSRAPSELPAPHQSSHPEDHLSTFHGLTESGEPTPAAATNSPAANQDTSRTHRLVSHPDIAHVPSVSEVLDHIAGESITDSEAAGYTFRAEEDAELEGAVAMLNEHRKLQRRENEELRMMQLTAQQLQEMTENESGMCDVEYFNSKYFSDETQKVWSERAANDASPESKHTVRLFGAESAILSQARATREAKAKAKAAGQHGDESLALSHPLLHRRTMRNEERRAAFRAAALERQAANEAPSMRNADASSLDHKSIYSPQRDLFGRNRPLVTFKGRAAAPAALTADEVEEPQSPAGDVTIESSAMQSAASAATLAPSDSTGLGGSNETAAPAPPQAPRTLAEMLVDQQKSLADMKTSDEEVYKPVLDAFYRYDAAVHDKLGRIIDGITTNGLVGKDAALDSASS